MIEFKNVSYNYFTKFYSLYKFSYCFDAGNYALIGDYIDGNLNVIRLLSKLDKLYKGDIFINGKTIKKISFKKDINIAYLSKNPVFFEHKTVLQNLIYPLKSRGLKKDEYLSKCRQALTNFGWKEKENLKVACLSQPEKLILSLIRASVRDLDILLCEDIFDTVNFDLLQKISATTTILALNHSPAPEYFTKIYIKLGCINQSIPE